MKCPAWITARDEHPRPSSRLRNMEKEEPEPRLKYPVEDKYQPIATAMTNAGIDAIYIQGTPFFPTQHIWKAGRMKRWVAEHGIESGEGEFHVPMSDSDYSFWLSQQDLVYEADPEKLNGFDSRIDEIISFFSVQKIYVVKGGTADQYIRRNLNEDNSVTINNQCLPDITTITIEGYRSLEHVHIELRRINILIGANGSGKSNFISFFDLIRAIIQSGLQNYIGKHGGANAQFFLGTKHTKHISAKIEIGENTYEFKLSADTNDGCYFEKEIITFWIRRLFRRPYKKCLGGYRETHLMEELPRERTVQSFTRENIESWIVYHFHDTGDSSPLKRTAKIDDIAHLYPDGSNLAAYLYHLQKNAPDHYHGIISAIQLILPGFQDFTYLIQSDNITLQWKTTTSGDYALPISAFSDGTLRFIAIATLFLQPTPPKLIIIDEPELGLHPYAISILAEFVHNASRKSQVIISTQSTHLVSEFSPEDIIITENTNNATTFRHLSSFEALKEWMNDYTLGDIWRSNLIGGNP